MVKTPSHFIANRHEAGVSPVARVEGFPADTEEEPQTVSGPAEQNGSRSVARKCHEYMIVFTRDTVTSCARDKCNHSRLKETRNKSQFSFFARVIELHCLCVMCMGDVRVQHHLSSLDLFYVWLTFRLVIITADV